MHLLYRVRQNLKMLLSGPFGVESCVGGGRASLVHLCNQSGSKTGGTQNLSGVLKCRRNGEADTKSASAVTKHISIQRYIFFTTPLTLCSVV